MSIKIYRSWINQSIDVFRTLYTQIDFDFDLALFSMKMEHICSYYTQFSIIKQTTFYGEIHYCEQEMTMDTSQWEMS